MNLSLAPQRSLDRARQPLLDPRTPRLSALDRLSLRLGLWLLLRGARRLHRVDDRDRHARARAVHRARSARDAVGVEHLLRSTRT